MTSGWWDGAPSLWNWTHSHSLGLHAGFCTWHEICWFFEKSKNFDKALGIMIKKKKKETEKRHKWQILVMKRYISTGLTNIKEIKKRYYTNRFKNLEWNTQICQKTKLTKTNTRKKRKSEQSYICYRNWIFYMFPTKKFQMQLVSMVTPTNYLKMY